MTKKAGKTPKKAKEPFRDGVTLVPLLEGFRELDPELVRRVLEMPTAPFDTDSYFAHMPERLPRDAWPKGAAARIRKARKKLGLPDLKPSR